MRYGTELCNTVGFRHLLRDVGIRQRLLFRNHANCKLIPGQQPQGARRSGYTPEQHWASQRTAPGFPESQLAKVTYQRPISIDMPTSQYQTYMVLRRHGANRTSFVRSGLDFEHIFRVPKCFEAFTPILYHFAAGMHIVTPVTFITERIQSEKTKTISVKNITQLATLGLEALE